MPNDLHLHQKQPEYFDSTQHATLAANLTAIPTDKGHQKRFQQENQKLIVRPDMVTSNIEVLIKINITGSTRKPYSKLVTKFPDYFTLQLSRGHSNFINIVENRIEIDLLKLTTTVQQKNVSFEREVEFNISLDSHNVGNSDYIKFDFDRFISNPLINFDSTGLTIEQKGQ